MLPLRHRTVIFSITFIMFAIVALTFASDDNPDKKGPPSRMSTELYESYALNINNVFLPMTSYGTLGLVSVDDRYGIYVDDNVVTYGMGFYLTGESSDILFSNGQLTYYRGNDYIAGAVGMDPFSPKAKLYKLKRSEGDFADSWFEWVTAVELGAYYYDGDGDGNYFPIDLNGNGKWDANEDRPDLIGDETVWCLLNDGVDPAFRRISDVNPQGIEIGQTIFAYASETELGNVFFIRYTLLNTGFSDIQMDSVYFSFWADPDIGAYWDDLIGSDPELSSVYCYNEGSDNRFGSDPPGVMLQMLQNPVVQTGSGSDTAYFFNSSRVKLDTITGARNLPVTATNHIVRDHPTQSFPTTKEQVNYLLKGLNNDADTLDPCTFGLGTVLGNVPCGSINPFMHFSGDPVEQKGWLMNEGDDYSMIISTGPFTLLEKEPVDILGAFIYARGNDSRESVDKLRQTAAKTRLLYQKGFETIPSLPAAEPFVRSGDGFIELSWNTAEQVAFEVKDTLLGIRRNFQAYNVYACKTANASMYVDGQQNRFEADKFELRDSIASIYIPAENGGLDLLLQSVDDTEGLLDSVIYGDPGSGRITIRFYSDPITGGELIKGHQYNFLISTFYLDESKLETISGGTANGQSDYLLPSLSGYQEVDSDIMSIRYGEDMFSPAYYGREGNLSDGHADGKVKYFLLDPNEASGHKYSVTVKHDTAKDGYINYWLLKNETTNTLLDSSYVFNFDTTDFSGKTYDGFLLKVQTVVPAVASFTDQQYESVTGNVWCTPFNSADQTGVYYAGNDISQPESFNPLFPNASGSFIDAGNLRNVEIRFRHNSGKAYRYLNGFGSNPIGAIRNYFYAEGITAADTIGRGPVGKFGSGFVDVPFTAWIRDEKYGEERQLAVGFIERSAAFGGNPDGSWDPGTDLDKSREVIIIFNSPYNSTGSNMLYTGGRFDDGSVVWADVVNGYDIPESAANPDSYQRTAASHSFFDVIYTVNLQRQNDVAFYADDDKLTVPVPVYPYNGDVFAFTTQPGGEITGDEGRALFNKVNVFPNPLFAYNPASAYGSGNYDRPFVTFSHLPREIKITIFSLSGMKLRTLTEEDKASPSSSFLEWDLKTSNGISVASGMYIAIVESPLYGQKILKFSIIMPQYQLRKE